MDRNPKSRTKGRRTRGGRRAAGVVCFLALLIVAGLCWAPAAQAQDDAEVYVEGDVPARVDPGQALIGKHMFRSFCASCHGAEAHGDGSIAEMLRVPPTDLTTLAKNNEGEFPFARCMAVIDGRVQVQGHGTAEMPAWGDAFAEISESEDEVQTKIRQLVHFIWSIQEDAETPDE